MARRRSISCPTCGFLQLKRDAYCDECGRMTVIEKKNLALTVTRVIAVLIMVGFVLSRTAGFGAAFGH